MSRPLGTRMSSHWSHCHGPFSWHLSHDPSESQSSPCAHVRLAYVMIYATVIPGEISVTTSVFVHTILSPFFCTLCKAVRLVPLRHASVNHLNFLFVSVCVCVCVCVCVRVRFCGIVSPMYSRTVTQLSHEDDTRLLVSL